MKQEVYAIADAEGLIVNLGQTLLALNPASVDGMLDVHFGQDKIKTKETLSWNY